jgi:hypothetical protein
LLSEERGRDLEDQPRKEQTADKGNGDDNQNQGPAIADSVPTTLPLTLVFRLR